MTVIDTEFYWVMVSKRKTRLWRSKTKADYYDFIYSTKEELMSGQESKYYKPMRVKVELLEEETE